MENTLRIIITIFFVGLIALAIILFGVFGLTPLGQVGKEKKIKTPSEIVLNDGTTQVTQNGENFQPSSQQGERIQPPAGTNNTPPKETNNTSPTITPTSTQPTTPVSPSPTRPIKLDVPPGSPDAPKQSPPVSRDSLLIGSPEIIAKDGKLTPQNFAVKEGEEITLAFTSGDKRTHILIFDDEALMAVAIGVGPNETRTIKFKVPKAGVYTFSCSVPGHASAGEIGSMTVIK